MCSGVKKALMCSEQMCISDITELLQKENGWEFIYITIKHFLSQKTCWNGKSCQLFNMTEQKSSCCGKQKVKTQNGRVIFNEQQLCIIEHQERIYIARLKTDDLFRVQLTFWSLLRVITQEDKGQAGAWTSYIIFSCDERYASLFCFLMELQEEFSVTRIVCETLLCFLNPCQNDFEESPLVLNEQSLIFYLFSIFLLV